MIYLFIQILASLSLMGALSLIPALEQPKAMSSNNRVEVVDHQFTHLLSLGFNNLWSDMLWIDFLLKNDHETRIPENSDKTSWEYRVLKSSLTFDPRYRLAYEDGGAFLSVLKEDRIGAEDILLQGIRYCGDESWRLHFQLGYHYYFEMNKPLEAAKAFEGGAKVAGAPFYLKQLSSRLYAQGGNLEASYTLMKALKENSEGEVKEEYKRRLKLIKMEIFLERLNRFAVEYQRKTGQKLSRLEDLVEAGIVSSLPQEPLGGEWLVTSDGRVETTTQKRFRAARNTPERETN